MAKIISPLHSTGARGKLAKSLIFRQQGGIKLATGFYFPGSKKKYTPSVKQLAARETYKTAVASWNQLSIDEKSWYIENAKGQKLTGYNHFMAYPDLITSFAQLGALWLGLAELGNEP